MRRIELPAEVYAIENGSRARIRTFPTYGVIVVVLLFLVSTLAGCTIDTTNPSSRNPITSTTPEPVKPTISIEDGMEEVEVTTPIKVSSEDPLTAVTLVNNDGVELEGQMSADKLKWEFQEKLGYGRTYTLTAKTKNTESTRSFSTMNPAAQSNGALSPLDGSVVGIGQTISLRFDQIIQDKEAVEKAFNITTEPQIAGAFYWINGQEVRWRPEQYWAPGTVVTVDVNLYGTDLGGGVYGAADRHAQFTIGDAVVALADDATKQLTITRNGEVEKQMPISMGSAAHPTPHGVYIIGDQYDRLRMDSSTFGLVGPGSYDQMVDFATQMSYSGVYIHSAPWSVASQGVENVSHGCLNVSAENAKWIYDFLKRGDIVEVRGTTGPLLDGNEGLGDWNIPWETWSAGNSFS